VLCTRSLHFVVRPKSNCTTRSRGYEWVRVADSQGGNFKICTGARPEGRALDISRSLLLNKSFLASAAIALLMTSVPTVAQAAWQLPPPDPEPVEVAGPRSTASCDSQLGHMPRVYKSQIEAIDSSSRIWVTELCPGFSMLRSEGNGAYLSSTIAANELLAEALGRKGYRAQDVFAVQILSDNIINLFVGRFR
jgi:hypothetical protein